MKKPDADDVTTDAPNRIGPYTLSRQIGTGGMGTVWGASGPDGEVALKILSGRIDGLAAKRFAREALIRIDHDNVVKVLDADVAEDGRPYIALELLQGESLKQRLTNERRMSQEEAVSVAIQACRGLAAVHRAGYIHRDVKPGNLFLGTDGVVRVLDFGIARQEDAPSDLTKTGTVLGTTAYLAPEQARGEKSVSRCTDVWGLGCVLYRALAGRSPFERGNELATVLAIILEGYEPLPLLAPHVSAELEATIARALAKDPAERWPDMEAFQDALERLAIVSAEPTRHERSAPFHSDEERVVAVLLASEVTDTARLERAIEARGGRVIPLRGERVIGVFGAQTWEGDEVRRAADAALAAAGTAARIAVASGRALRSRGGVSGRAVIEAEKLITHGGPGLLVAPDVASALAEGYELEYAPSGVFALIARKRGTTTEERRLTDLTLGREVEVAQIRRALSRCFEERRATTVLVTGPVGIGKTRLKQELERLLEKHTGALTILTGRAESHGVGSSLHCFAAAIDARRQQIRERDRVEDPVELVRTLVDDALQDETHADGCAEFIGHLLDVRLPPTDLLDAARSDGRLMADRLRIAVLDYFGGLVRRGPLVLFLEDLQWADDASFDLLDELVIRFEDQPLLVFVTAREHHGRFTTHNLVRIEPQGLGRSDVARLIAAIAGRPVLDKLAQKIARVTAGNPLFVEHVVRALVDQALLDADLDDLPLPVAVEAAIQSRLDHLPPVQKSFCKAVSVFDRPFSVADAEALGLRDAKRVLDELLRSRFMSARSRSEPGARRYWFKSELVAEVAYNLLGPERARALHLDAAAALRRRGGATSAEIARHLERAGEFRRAARWYARATIEAWRRGDGADVLRCSEGALAYGVSKRRQFLMHLARSDAFQFQGKRREQAESLDAAIAVAQTRAHRARALAERSWVLLRTGERDAALTMVDEAVDEARGADDPAVLIWALGRQLTALRYTTDLDHARDVYSEVGALTVNAAPHLRALAAGWRGQLASASGDLEEQRVAFGIAATLYRNAGDVRRAAGAETNLADALNHFGAFAEAQTALQKAREDCRRVGHRTMEGYALLNLGHARTMLGRYVDAMDALDEAQKIAEETNERRLDLLQASYRARVEIITGSVEAGLVNAKKAAVDAEADGRPLVLVAALALVADGARLLGDVDAALGASARALELRDELGGLEEGEAAIFLARADALVAAGDHVAARAVVQRGLDWLGARASSVRDPEWRRRLIEDVPAHRRLRSPGW